LEVSRSLSGPFEYVDDYEGRVSQRNQSSGKKKAAKKRTQDIQNDQDSFSKDKKKEQPTQQAQKPQTQPAQPTNTAAPTQQKPQTQAPQTNQPNTAAPTQQKPNTAAPTQQKPQTQAPQVNQPNTAAPTQQKPNTQPLQSGNQQGQNAPQGTQPANKPIEKNDLVMLKKKPYMVDTYNFGQEQRRGGSTK
jgi:hypothetical protein